jgi:Cellulase (glycosyl hydrolase family 5)
VQTASRFSNIMLSWVALTWLACGSGGDGATRRGDASVLGGSPGAATGATAGAGGAAAGSGGAGAGGAAAGAAGNAAGAGGAAAGAGTAAGAGGAAAGAAAGGATADGGSASGASSPGGAAGGSAGSNTGTIPIDRTPGKWHTDRDTASGRFVFISPEGEKKVLRGVSMTGMETGTRHTSAGAGFWLFNAQQGDEAVNAPKVLENVVDVLTQEWKSDVVRIPICGSAWTQQYQVKDWGNKPVKTYKDWVDIAVKKARAAGKVVIIDLHLWAIAKISKGGTDRGTFTLGGQSRKYADFEDGCTGNNAVDGTSSCAPSDWFTGDGATWECAIANADGVTLHNAHKNREQIRAMWVDIANRYKSDSAIWFELFNEPYTRLANEPYPAVGPNQEEQDYPWELWSEVMNLWIAAIREQASASNIIIANGLDWGYSFGPGYGPISFPDKYLPWKTKYPNLAYGFHPYQHGSCCGRIGGGSGDESVADPYQSAYCAYYPDGMTWGEPSSSPLPGGASCIQKGYAETQDKKMPPCHWVANAQNPKTSAKGLCAGDRVLCSGLTKAQCDQVDPASPEAGGWSKYALPMNQFGPLIATEFGTFDCSSPYVTKLLDYMRDFDISYTAWALWPQNSGGPGGLGACGYPSVMSSSASGDFRQCLDRAACAGLIKPLPWAGAKVFDDIVLGK